jgi:hypothetical protein
LSRMVEEGELGLALVVVLVRHSALVSVLASESGELCHGGHRTVRSTPRVRDGREREEEGGGEAGEWARKLHELGHELIHSEPRWDGRSWRRG